MDRVEILPYGTVEREAREDGDRIYTLAELPELLEELRAFKRDPFGEQVSEALTKPVLDPGDPSAARDDRPTRDDYRVDLRARAVDSV